MHHLDLFSGIGGFALAADWVWPKNKHVFCEIDPFCRKVLKKHWPTSKIYGDIRRLSADAYHKRERRIPVERQQNTQDREPSSPRRFDILTGGFPCQPFSTAGKRRGTEDQRYLWPEMRRIISEFSPRWIVGENVRGLLSIERGMVFEQMCLDLESLDYSVQPFVLPAGGVNAPHRRERVWIVCRHAERVDGGSAPVGNVEREVFHQGRRQEVADQANGSGVYDPDAESLRRRQGRTNAGGLREGTPPAQKRHRPANGYIDPADTKRARLERADGEEQEQRQLAGFDRGRHWSQETWIQAATRLCSLDDGFPGRLVRSAAAPRKQGIKAAGNAIVPQVAALIFEAIRSYEQSIG